MKSVRSSPGLRGKYKGNIWDVQAKGVEKREEVTALSFKKYRFLVVYVEKIAKFAHSDAEAPP